MMDKNLENHLHRLTFLPIVVIPLVVLWAFTLPTKPIVFSEAFTESVYLMLALYALTAIYHLKSKLIFFGWGMFCLGQTLDLLDEFFEIESVLDASVEDWLGMTGIMMFALGFNQKNRLLAVNLSQQQEKAQELSELAFIDKLTGIANRSCVVNSLDELTKTRTPYAVHFIDLVKFKPANDKYGHDVGDLILQAVASRLTNIARKTDVVGRWGGDEFIVLQSGNNDEDAAKLFAMRLHGAFHAPFEIQGLSISIGASIGVALFPHHGDSYSEVIKKADLAMYQCKQNPGRPLLFDGQLTTK